jgi:hypothetical protein
VASRLPFGERANIAKLLGTCRLVRNKSVALRSQLKKLGSFKLFLDEWHNCANEMNKKIASKHTTLDANVARRIACLFCVVCRAPQPVHTSAEAALALLMSACFPITDLRQGAAAGM